jgi:hypothetical protein
MVVIYTEAPEEYDGFSTRTLSVWGVSRRGNPVRKVYLDDGDFLWQTGRYDSGMHAWTLVGPLDPDPDRHLRTKDGYRCTFNEFVKLGDWKPVGSRGGA